MSLFFCWGGAGGACLIFVVFVQYSLFLFSIWSFVYSVVRSTWGIVEYARFLFSVVGFFLAC